MGRKHENLIKIFHLKLSESVPNARFFKRDTGKFLKLSVLKDFRNFHKHFITINRPGMADGYILLSSKHIECEFKTGKDSLNKQQKAWRDLCTSLKIPFYTINEFNIDSVIKEISTM